MEIECLFNLLYNRSNYNTTKELNVEKRISVENPSNRDLKRQQLVAATIQTISEFGLSNTTIAKVTKRAEMSAGIINFYFENKEKLLLGTLEALSQEFRTTLEQSIEKANAPMDRLHGIINAYFTETSLRRGQNRGLVGLYQ